MGRIYYILGILAVMLPEVARGEYRYRLHLDGKPESSLVQWSERAEQRRQRLGLEPDSLDLEVSPQYLDSIRMEGWQVVTQSRWLNTVVVMQTNGKMIPEEQLQNLTYVTDYEVLTKSHRATSRHRDVDAQAVLGGENPVGDNCTSPLKQVNAYTSLYEAGYRGEGMLIAVLDAGFQKVDRWDWLSSRVVGSRDLYARTEAASKVYTADNHGSCCMSIMATPEEHGVCGTAQDALYYLVRTETLDSESGLEEDMWVAGAELADSLGVDVISSSLGYYEFDAGLVSHSKDEFAQLTATISRGAKVACQKGMLVCNAAGNEGDASWGSLLFPADVDDVLTVGGVNKDGQMAYFSSRGFTVPYVKPDVLGRAMNCYTLNVYSQTGAATSSGSGTSYATPMIAGLCASLWSAVPELTPQQLREAVRQSASHYLSPDSIHGYGLPDFAVALDLAREWTGHEDEEGMEILVEDTPCPESYTLYGIPCKEERKGQNLLIESGKIVYRKHE